MIAFLFTRSENPLHVVHTLGVARQTVVNGVLGR